MNAKSYDSAPKHLNALNVRLANIAKAGGGNELRLRSALANAIVAQMLPPGVVKGGTAMKLRVGEPASRFTPDLDAARAANVTVEDYIDDFDRRLTEGWHGFTGRIRTLKPADPPDVPADYVMQPFEVKLAYLGKAWLTVTFELGHDEIGSTATPAFAMADALVALFRQLGFPDPAPVPVLAVEHQIAQKLTPARPRTATAATTGHTTSSTSRSSSRPTHPTSPHSPTPVAGALLRLAIAGSAAPRPGDSALRSRWRVHRTLQRVGDDRRGRGRQVRSDRAGCSERTRDRR